MFKFNTHKDAEDLKRSFRKAARALTKEGVYTRSNFWCCQSCGLSAISQISKEDKRYKGYCFYHNQDNENLLRDGIFYLAWGSMNENPTEAERLEIGKIIIKTLNANGLKTQWDENPSHRIKVYGNSITEEELKE